MGLLKYIKQKIFSLNNRPNTLVIETNTHVIEFFLYEKDEAMEIQLEPEAIRFIVKPGKPIRFVAINCQDKFEWSTRIVHDDKSIQLFPCCKFDYEIEIYEDDQLLEDWYKYMR